MTRGMGDPLYEYQHARRTVREHLNKEQYESIVRTLTINGWDSAAGDWDKSTTRLFAIAELILKVPPPQFPGSQPGYGDDEIAYLHYQWRDHDLYVFDRHSVPLDGFEYPTYGVLMYGYLEFTEGNDVPLMSMCPYPHTLDGEAKLDENWKPKPYGEFRLQHRAHDLMQNK